MKCSIRISLLVGALTVLPGGSYGQDPPTLLDNVRQLQVSLSPDRDTYFPGESAFFNLTLRNLKSTPLEVPPPLSADGGCFTLAKLSESGFPALLSTVPICPFRDSEMPAATTVIEVGGQRQMTISSDDLIPSLRSSAGNHPGVLNSPGYYQIDYQYSHSSAVFRIVRPRLEAATVVRLQDVSRPDPKAGNRRAAAYRHVFALRWRNESFICVSLFPTSRETAIVADTRGTYKGGDFPYVRIASSIDPVASMVVTANAQDHLVISWQDSNGVRHIKLFDTIRRDAEPGALHVALDPTYGKLSEGETQPFNATLIGSANTKVKWSVALTGGAPAGAEPGHVSSSGMYTAPAKIDRPYMVIIKASSQADTSKSALAMVSLLPTTQKYTSATSSPMQVLPEQ
jgi:hypothetical protein